MGLNDLSSYKMELLVYFLVSNIPDTFTTLFDQMKWMEDSIKGFANSNSSVVGGQFTEGSQGVLCFYGGTDAYIDEKYVDHHISSVDPHGTCLPAEP